MTTASDVTLDPAVQSILDIMSGSLYADLESMPLEQAMLIARPAAAAPAPPQGTEDLTIRGREGVPIRIRLYRPDSGTSMLPVLVHLHGGGFVAGSIEQDDSRCVWLAREVGCIVVSVDYRLAPEHAFPNAVEDAFDVWKWVAEQAAGFGGDARRCAISGSSAGGHVAVGVTLLSRGRGVPMPRLQLLTYPVIDPSLVSLSYQKFENGPFLTKARMAWFWKQYKGSNAPSGNLWHPLSAQTKGLPPAHVITAEYDVLRDEGEAYAAHLRAAGIMATVERYAGMIHGFITVVPKHEASRAALLGSAMALREAFALTR